VNRIGGFCIVIAGVLILSGCSSPVSSSKGTPITLESITANGSSGTETTDTLTLTFSAEPSTLSVDHITVIGATKGILTGSDVTRSLSISEITAKNGKTVKVTLSNPPNFVVSGASQKVTINVKDGERFFWARKAKSSDTSWYKVAATRKEVTEAPHCEVYVDNDLTGEHAVSDAVAQAIATKFESEIYTSIQEKFDVVSDVDNDGKITILLLDIQDDYKKTDDPYVAGYFDGTHQLSGQRYEKYSNLTDMLFVDTNPGFRNSTTFYRTLAHELQHLINFNHNYINGGGHIADTWINEGLSTAAEYFYNDNRHVQPRIDHYNNSNISDENATVNNAAIKYGAYFFNWSPSWTTDKLASYATVYLFFQWLRIQSDNGNNIYKSIYAQRNMNLASFLTAVNTHGVGSTWKDILGNWFTANLFNNTSGLYGYKEEITLTPPAFNASSKSRIDLYPGEGVYIYKSDDSYSPTAQTNIAHIGLNTTLNPKQKDTTTPFVGNYHLVYNYNSNKSGPKVAAHMPTGSVSLSLSASHSHGPSASYSVPPSTASWPIDIVFDPFDPSDAAGESENTASQKKTQH